MFQDEWTCARPPWRALFEPVLMDVDWLYWPLCDTPTETPPRWMFDDVARQAVLDFLRSRDTVTRPVVIVVPAGAPAWITIELIRDTLDVWQPYYWTRLTSEDALEILLNVGGIIDCLEKSA